MSEVKLIEQVSLEQYLDCIGEVERNSEGDLKQCITDQTYTVYQPGRSLVVVVHYLYTVLRYRLHVLHTE